MNFLGSFIDELVKKASIYTQHATKNVAKEKPKPKSFLEAVKEVDIDSEENPSFVKTEEGTFVNKELSDYKDPSQRVRWNPNQNKVKPKGQKVEYDPDTGKAITVSTKKDT